MNQFALVLTLAFLSGDAVSQTRRSSPHIPEKATAVQSWDREPTTFVGLTLGAPFDEQIKRCPQSTFNYKGPICSRGGMQGIELLEGYPTLGLMMHGMVAANVKNRLQAVAFQADHSDLMRVKALLEEKYGPALDSLSYSVQTSGGVQGTGRRWRWQGRTVTLRLDEFVESLSTCGVTIEMNDTAALSTDIDKQNARRQADKL